MYLNKRCEYSETRLWQTWFQQTFFEIKQNSQFSAVILMHRLLRLNKMPVATKKFGRSQTDSYNTVLLYINIWQII